MLAKNAQTSNGAGHTSASLTPLQNAASLVRYPESNGSYRLDSSIGPVSSTSSLLELGRVPMNEKQVPIRVPTSSSVRQLAGSISTAPGNSSARQTSTPLTHCLGNNGSHRPVSSVRPGSSTSSLFTIDYHATHENQLPEQTSNGTLLRQDVNTPTGQNNNNLRAVIPRQVSNAKSTTLARNSAIPPGVRPLDVNGRQKQGNTSANLEQVERHGQKHSLEQNSDVDFQRKMLKMVGTVVNLLEEQRNPKIVKERIVMENAHHFQDVLSSNVKLPLTVPSQIEDLNNALIDIELSVAMVISDIYKKKSRSLNIFNF